MDSKREAPSTSMDYFNTPIPKYNIHGKNISDSALPTPICITAFIIEIDPASAA